MSQYAPPVPQQTDWPLKPSGHPEHGAPTPPAFNTPSSLPPTSSPAWQGIRLPTTPSHHHSPYYHHPYNPYHKLPHRPTALNPMGEEDFRRQRHILSPQPRYPQHSPSPHFQHNPRIELDLLRQQQAASGGGFWSPQPGRSSFTSPPPGTHHTNFHSPPPHFHQSQAATLPPKFLAKQSPSITPSQAGLHPNHQQSQLSVSLTGTTTTEPGLLSIQTAPTSTTGHLEPKQEFSPSSTTASLQDPATSSSDDPQHSNGDNKSTHKDEDKDDGCHSTAASPPHVSTTRISPGNQDNSSTSATDTPNSISPEDDDKPSEDQQDDTSTGPANENSQEDDPMETDEVKENGNDHAQASPTQENGESKPCDSAQEVNRQNTDHDRPISATNRLVMDVESQGHGERIESETPISISHSSPTLTSRESAQALLSLSQQGLPQPSENNVTAALRLEEKIAEEAFRRAAGYLSTVSSAGGVHIPPHFAAQATVTRPPGLGPAPLGTSPLAASFTAFGRPGLSGFPNQQQMQGGAAPYQCPICGFSSTSKFHFNSHMNTHTDHQCTMCDYTARTEGRLKRHMEGHSDEEKVRAGVNHIGEPMKTPAGPRSSDGSSGSVGTPERGSGEASNHSQEPSPLERLQMQLEEATPSSITASVTGTPRSDDGTHSVPRRSNSSSKPKNYKCKQCEHISRSKEESWRHARVHIKPDKLLTCPQCEFVTEYKHHLEYHLRNHFGSKPFQCQKCHYSCVNKSMLNSHMKSHSQFYQFRCSDCTYATKYCHSLKLHLRKYNHRPATVVTPDGQQIDPSQNLDLYGNRARARQRHRESSSPSFGSPTNSLHGDHQGSPGNPMMGSMGSPGVSAPTMVTAFDALQFHQQHQQNSAMANSIATLGARLPTIPTIASLQMQMKQALIQRQQELQAAHLKCPNCDYQATTKDDLDKHSLSHLPGNGLLPLPGQHLATLYGAMAARAHLVSQAVAQPEIPDEHHDQEHSPPATSPTDIGGDGSAASSGSPISKGSGDEGSGTGTGSTSDKGGSSRRKGKARKLDSIARRLQECRSVEHPAMDESEHAPKAPSAPIPHHFAHDNKEVDWDSAFVCRHCRMAFMHEVMYQIHMGFHGYDNPFRCNRCGHDSPDEVTHFMHIAQSKH